MVEAPYDYVAFTVGGLVESRSASAAQARRQLAIWSRRSGIVTAMPAAQHARITREE